MYSPHATVNTRLLTKPDLHHISAALYELHAQKMDVPEIKQVITAYKKMTDCKFPVVEPSVETCKLLF